MTATRSRLLLAALVSVVLAACSVAGGGGGSDASGSAGPGGSGSQPGTVAKSDLEGRTFLSTAVEGYELAPDSQVRLTFTPDGLSANAGCNTMGGAYELVGGMLTTDALAMTEMACPDPLMAQDAWLAGILQKAALDLGGDTLILSVGETRIVMGDEQAVVPDRPLLGTTWVLDTIITGDAASSVPAGVEATLRIADGRIEVLTGCNGGSGEARVKQGGTLALGPIGATKMACEPDRMALESTIFGVLRGEVPYAVDGDRLTIGSGPTQLVYRATE